MNKGHQDHLRWNQVARFLAEWNRPLQSNDGVDLSDVEEAEGRLGFRLPNALREWYLVSGRRSSHLVSQTNFLLLPKDLRIYDGALVFYAENQSVVHWGILEEHLDLDDPPVHVEGDYVNILPRVGWIRENETTSQFIFQMEVMDTIAYSDLSATCPSNKTSAERARMTFVSFGFPAWHWPVYPTELFRSSEVLVELQNNNSFVIAAQNELALSHALGLLER